MDLKIDFSKKAYPFSNTELASYLKDFQDTVGTDQGKFFQITENQETIQDCKNVLKKFQGKDHFVHIGIGGSSLGPEMLIKSLAPLKITTKFTFLNNIDPQMISEELELLEGKKSLFFFVSKSGNTIETLAILTIIKNWLKEKKVSENEFKNYFVFCSDPEGGTLNSLHKSWGISKLTIPKDLGGRFSVLSPVGILPALFADINMEEVFKGANAIKSEILSENLAENPLILSAAFLLGEKNQAGINQTVLMPYSSKLKWFGDWFVQLWAESLGKKKNIHGNSVYQGMTPISGYGATDQHSQMQLFVEGPKDKVLLFLEIEKFSKNYDLTNSLNHDCFKLIKSISLGKLLKAELEGTLKTFRDIDRPYIHLQLPELREFFLGQLILFFESLTLLMGKMLEINPFDQPGVEHGKRNALTWLQS